jgi:hypothetical protein
MRSESRWTGMAVRLLMALLLGLFLALPTLAQERPGAAEYPALTSAGEVSLTVQPEWRDSVLAFRVSAESHTVELAGIDLVRSMRLMLDGAPAIAPAQAGALGGHHAAAEVEFRATQRPSRFTLLIRGIPDIEERRLEWPPEPR